MLNCKISKGHTQDCETNVGGILKLAFANYGDNYVFTQSSGTCEVDTIDLGTEKVYEVAFLDGTGLAEVELNVGDSPDLKNFTHRITATFGKLDCDLLDDYLNWSLAHVIAFVQTKNGEVFAFGVDNGLAATTFNYSSGTAGSDANGVSAVFEGIQKAAPVKISSWSVVEALKA